MTDRERQIIEIARNCKSHDAHGFALEFACALLEMAATVAEDQTTPFGKGASHFNDGCEAAAAAIRHVAQPANTDSVPGSPLGSGARPSEQDAPVSSIGLGAEGEQ